MKHIRKIVKSGKHNSRPFTLPRRGGELTFDVEFNESCVYEFEDKSYQNSWSKLIGLKKSYFKPKQDSVILAWRYTPDIKAIEIMAYMHVDGEVKKNYPILRVGIHDRIRGHIKPSSIMSYETMSDKVHVELDNFDKGWLIMDWFGGKYGNPNTNPIIKDFNYEMVN